MVKVEVGFKIRRAYGEGRAGHELEVESLGPKKPTLGKTQLTVERWGDLAIGIDEHRVYWAITPCPDRGHIFPIRSAKKVGLEGAQWRFLLEELAGSEGGNTASRKELIAKFGYLPSSAQVNREGYEDAEDNSLPNEESRAKGNGHSKSHSEPDVSQMAKDIRRQLSGAIADLARKLRNRVAGPGPKAGRPLYACGENICSAFVVRFLLRDDEGRLRFGKP